MGISFTPQADDKNNSPADLQKTVTSKTCRSSILPPQVRPCVHLPHLQTLLPVRLHLWQVQPISFSRGPCDYDHLELPRFVRRKTSLCLVVPARPRRLRLPAALFTGKCDPTRGEGKLWKRRGSGRASPERRAAGFPCKADANDKQMMTNLHV